MSASNKPKCQPRFITAAEWVAKYGKAAIRAEAAK